MEKNKQLLSFLESTSQAKPSEMTAPVSNDRVFSMQMDEFDRKFATKFNQYQRLGKGALNDRYAVAYGKTYQDRGQIPAHY